MATSRLSVLPCFVPVNVDDETERKLFYDQRVICGWKFSVVDKMFQEVRLSQRMLYWVCIPATADLHLSDDGSVVLADGDEIERKIEAKDCIRVPLLPARSQYRIGPLSDEAHGGSPVDQTGIRTDDESPGLLPVGHISIDTRDFDTVTTPLLGADDGRTLSITTLFVMPYHRKLGLARWSMQECERRIRAGVQFAVPSSAETVNAAPQRYMRTEKIALSCLAERHHIADSPGGREFWNRQGLEFLVRGNGQRTRYLGDWYRSLGYERIHAMEKFTETNRLGEVFRWWAEIWCKEVT